LAEASNSKYSIDTCSLIDGYAEESIRLLLEQLVKKGRLKAARAVLTELERGGDETFAWAKDLEQLLIEELSEDSAIQAGHLVVKYGEPFPDPEDRGRTHRGLIKKGTAADADPDVIGLAMDHGWTVVTGERSGIKAACRVESVYCVSLEELVQIEGPKQERQLPLNLK
jgi:hypothetical protein